MLLSVGIHSHTHLDFRFDIFHGILRINRHRAEKTLEDLTARWPQREAPWVLRLRLAAALRDGAAIQKTLRQIEEKEVYLSAKGREIVRFWQGKQQ